MKPLTVGEKITAENAMKGLLIFSANDIAYMIANNIIGKLDSSVQDTNTDFSVLMNKKISQLGLKNTHFITPNGLHDPNHYTTAYDMSIVGKAAFSNKWILSTIEKKNDVFETEDGLSLPIENRNKLILTKETSLYDSTCLGGKTGYTEQAGKCLVSIYERNGRKIIGVVMKSAYDSNDTQVFKDMAAVMNYSYSIKYTALKKANSVYKTETITYKPLLFFGSSKTVNVPLVLKGNVNYYKNDVNDKEKKFIENLIPINVWKLNTSNSVGTVTLSERGVNKTYKVYPSISSNNIISDNKLLYGAIVVGVLALIAAITILVMKIVGLITRKKYKSYYR